MRHNEVEMTYEKRGFIDELTHVLWRVPIAITLYVFGGIAALTIILIPGAFVLFAAAQRILTGSYTVDCPSCSRNFTVQGGTPSKDCPHCKTPTVFTWKKAGKKAS